MNCQRGSQAYADPAHRAIIEIIISPTRYFRVFISTSAGIKPVFSFYLNQMIRSRVFNIKSVGK